jgi:hypothetical protein
MSFKEPGMYEGWEPYLRIRQMMIASIIFRNIGWKDFDYGHAKIFGIILWHYECTKNLNFKYCQLLRREGYGKTQNYALLKDLLDKGVLERKKNGLYEIYDKHICRINTILESFKSLNFKAVFSGEVPPG